MKIVYLILLLSAFYRGGNSQITDRGNSWNYLQIMWLTCEKNTQCDGKVYRNHKYTIGNDTVINNKTYSKVFVTINQNNGSYSEGYIDGFIRDEENNKKVYGLFPYLSDSVEILLYDFTFKKDSIFNSTYERLHHFPDGDTLITYTYFNSQVLDTDSVLYEGIKRLRITFLNFGINWMGENPVQDTVEWIEGIGSNKGLFNQGDFNLLCFKQNGELKYDNSFGVDCDYSGPVTNTKNTEWKKISIYPNPLKDGTLYVSGSDIINNISVFTISGVLVRQYSPGSSQCRIQLSNLQRGLYIVKADNYFVRLLVE